ncbi:MAG TPA: hypothetical protein VNL69_10130, partial [Bacteroidota bacterium]|nr:hypothetical protein [Bacteroidota bacterium]
HAFADGTFYAVLVNPEPGNPLNPRTLRSPERVLELSPVEVTWERTKTDDVVLTPEQTRNVVPELLVEKSERYPEGVKYDKLTLYLLELVKNQQREIAELRAMVQKLDATESRTTGTSR